MEENIIRKIFENPIILSTRGVEIRGSGLFDNQDDEPHVRTAPLQKTIVLGGIKYDVVYLEDDEVGEEAWEKARVCALQKRELQRLEYAHSCKLRRDRVRKSVRTVVLLPYLLIAWILKIVNRLKSRKSRQNHELRG